MLVRRQELRPAKVVGGPRYLWSGQYFGSGGEEGAEIGEPADGRRCSGWRDMAGASIIVDSESHLALGFLYSRCHPEWLPSRGMPRTAPRTALSPVVLRYFRRHALLSLFVPRPSLPRPGDASSLPIDRPLLACHDRAIRISLRPPRGGKVVGSALAGFDLTTVNLWPLVFPAIGMSPYLAARLRGCI